MRTGKRREDQVSSVRLANMNRNFCAGLRYFDNFGHVFEVEPGIDTLREQTLLKCQTLKKLKDGARDLELQSKSNAQEDTPVTRNIRMLENRLDKALIKFNEAQVLFILFALASTYQFCSQSKEHMSKL